MNAIPTRRPLLSLDRVSRALLSDLLLAGALIALDVVARFAPHTPNFTPVAATALFAAGVLRFRALSVLVPIIGMALGDAALGFCDYRVMTVVYGALVLPACAVCISDRLRSRRMVMPVLLSASLVFFLMTNLAVWAFSGMYEPDLQGLVKCYVAALPFLRYTLAGNLFWGLALFGIHWVLQVIRAPKSLASRGAAVTMMARY